MTSAPSALSLPGVIDIHCHCGPDSLARTIDAEDLARMAKQRGMRGIVLKNHYEPTASLAYMTRKAVPGIEIFGGVTLNLPVGGMNSHAVDHMARVSGGAGRFVWMGSLDTEAQVRYLKHSRPSVSVSSNGELLPEVKNILEVIARHNLILETGHSTSEEALMLIREACAQGVRQIVVTHAMIAPIHMQHEQMQEAASLGAWIEFVYNGLIGTYKEFEFADYARAIRAVGIDKCVLASDLGQPLNPSHPDGLVAFFIGMQKEGFTSAEIDLMSKKNPALILGLD
jgi:Family of unknown function (DUF6282)